MSAAEAATAEWLHTAGHQLRAHLDAEMSEGQPITANERSALYLLVRGMFEQRDALRRSHAGDPKVIEFPPPRHKGERMRPVDTWGGWTPGGAA